MRAAAAGRKGIEGLARALWSPLYPAALVIGSVARGTADPASDVDVLYELLPGRRPGWEIEQLADELSGILGRPVDLVSVRALHRRLRGAVLAEAQPLYAA